MSSCALSFTLRRHWLHDMLEYHAVRLAPTSTGFASLMISLNFCCRQECNPYDADSVAMTKSCKVPSQGSGTLLGGASNFSTRITVTDHRAQKHKGPQQLCCQAGTCKDTSMGFSPSADGTDDQTTSCVSTSTNLSGWANSLMCSTPHMRKSGKSGSQSFKGHKRGLWHGWPLPVTAKVARLTRWRSRGRQYLFQSARLADTVGCTSPSRRTAPNRDD
jgi:hypothetical protein